MYRNEERENALFIEVEKNIADEAEARMGYYRILEEFKDMLSDSEIADIREIISEELKHTILLENIIYRRNGIVAEE